MKFNTWLDTFLSEKNLDLDETFSVKSLNGTPNIMTYQNIVDVIKNDCGEIEQSQIKNTIVKIDFQNGNVKNYFKHLGEALAIDM